jgi:cell volume regulation protein A
MSTTILAIGAMIFLAHFLSLFFRKTNVPDVLVLMGVGLLLGPVLGWVHHDDFGKIGPIIATIALVVILFESGTSLRLDVMSRSLATTGKLTFVCFSLTVLLVSLVGFYLLELQFLPALLLAVILGGTSSAVVIPMVESLRLSEKVGTTVVLESALTDVLCIVGVFALLGVYEQGHVDAGKLLGSVLASLVFAAALGVAGGIGWLLILGRVRDFPNTISSTIAYAFIVYGVTETLGFAGAIAAMALGLTLTNYEQMGLKRFKSLSQDIEPLTATDLSFYRESVFLLKTYFFIYLGISIQFSSSMLVLIALAVMVAVTLMRTVLARFVFRADEFSLRDTAIASTLAPKGLAAAVLAAVPLQVGVPGAELIRDATYMVVLVSISLCALLVAIYPLSAVQRAYSVLLNKPR